MQQDDDASMTNFCFSHLEFPMQAKMFVYDKFITKSMQKVHGHLEQHHESLDTKCTNLLTNRKMSTTSWG
jgi:hypothetical protein